MISCAPNYEGLARRMMATHDASGSPSTMPPPEKKEAARLVELAKRILFPRPGCDPARDMGTHLESLLVTFDGILSRQIHLALASRHRRDREPGDWKAESSEISRAFMHQLPAIQAMLETDVQAAYRGDPALQCAQEALHCYPGIAATVCFRIAHALHELGVPLLPRMITEHANSTTGIDIHPGATIGEGFFIDHGTGVVIGGTAIIGRNVRLYQGVTLGAKSLASDANGLVPKGEPRHPILEDDVVIYSWASVLGRITIGTGSVVGGNVWVTRDVPPHSLVTQAKTISTGFAGGDGI